MFFFLTCFYIVTLMLFTFLFLSNVDLIIKSYYKINDYIKRVIINKFK